MDHSQIHIYKESKQNMSDYSCISYLLHESYEQGYDISDPSKYFKRDLQFTGDKLIISMWIRLDISNRGVNVLSLWGMEQDNKKCALKIDTEGAYFYSYDGLRKTKLCHFESDTWYGFYITVNLRTNTYSLFIDGERFLHLATLTHSISNVSELTCGSYGGKMLIKQICVYEDPCISPYDRTDVAIYNAKELGIPADANKIVTNELQQLIDTCSQTGGIVYLEGGTYVTGMLELKKNVTLYIEENATLKGTLDLSAYPVKLSTQHPNINTLIQGPQKALLYADSQENITICGGGTIDGSGDFPGEYGSESLRVSTILLVGCPNAKISNLYLKDAGMWTFPVVECDDLYIHDININSTWYPNRDGIDICDCYNVLIENCYIKCDDDAICFKSGNESGCDSVLIRNCFIISTMANGIKFGTYSYGGFTNCFCEDCIIKDTRTCAIAIECVDGGLIKNIQLKRILIENVESAFFILIGDKGRTPDWGSHRIGSIEDILFEDITVNRIRRSYGSYLGGFKQNEIVYPIRNILFRHVNATYQGGVTEIPNHPAEFGNQYPESNCFGLLPASAYYIRHAHNVRFEHCQNVIALPDVRNMIVCMDVDDFSSIE